MPFYASNDGLTVAWHDAKENYQPKAGEIAFAGFPTDEQLGAAFANHAAAVAAAQAAAKPKPTPRQWLERLAPATQLALHAAALKDTSGQTLLWLIRATGTPAIDVTAQETKDGVAALQAQGIVTAADAAALLAP